MKKLLVGFAFISLIGIASEARAQNATPTSKVAWTQTGQDLATVNGYGYKYYADGSNTGVVFPTPVTCTVAGTAFNCVVNIPAFTQGSHTMTVTASNIGGESPKSTSITFTFTVPAPATPTVLHIVP
jgi:hypothetical protein